jgi:hypothetical protein
MTIIATCHCGGTKLELPHAPRHATQCSCTYCTKSGGLWAYYEVDEVKITADANDRIYSPSSPLHEHHFCSKCGCTTYGIAPDYSLDDTEMPTKKKLGVNVKLLEDFALLKSLWVEEIDGRNLW